MGKHTGKYTCNACGKQYSSLTEKESHNCSSIPSLQKKIFPCQWCNKKFFRELYLRKHIKKFHKTTNESASDACELKEVICEICAEKFKSIHSLKQHMVQHGDPKFECIICSKKFHRKYVLSNHILSHGTPQLPCEICGKKLKTKKCLKVHMLQHGGEKKYSCVTCGKKFLQRTNMIRHQETHSNQNIFKCPICNKTFMSKFNLKNHQETHNFQLKNYKCEKCHKEFTKNHLLKKHYMHTHLDKVYSCPYCPRKFKHRNSIRRHLQQAHASCKAEWSDPVVISSLLVEAKNVTNKEIIDISSENMLSVELSSLKVPALVKVPIINNTEHVSPILNSVQIPPIEITTESLSTVSHTVRENEQQITLGKNAFILEDGTIVQPHDEGNIMIYVLDQQLTKT